MCKMRKVISFIVCVLVAVTAMAFDFTGKTFRGSTTMNGKKVTITYKFKANHRMSGTVAIAGSPSETDSGMQWEVSGDYLNFYDSTGDYSYMKIEEENGKIILIAYNSQGDPAMTFRQVVNTGSKKKK